MPSLKLIRLMYHEDYRRDFRMICDFCGKPETLEDDFFRCARCQSAAYCSRRCQKSDWDTHKRGVCKPVSDDETKKLDKIGRRLDRFECFFEPIIGLALYAKHALCELENKKVSHETHAMMVHVSDLPEDAKKPRLRIDKIEPMATADLPQDHRDVIENALRFFPPHRQSLLYFILYTTPEVQVYRPLLTLSRSHLMTDEFNNRRMMLTTLMACIQTINDIAKGKRPDLREFIKGKMDSNYELYAKGKFRS